MGVGGGGGAPEPARNQRHEHRRRTRKLQHQLDDVLPFLLRSRWDERVPLHPQVPDSVSGTEEVGEVRSFQGKLEGIIVLEEWNGREKKGKSYLYLTVEHFLSFLSLVLFTVNEDAGSNIALSRFIVILITCKVLRTIL